MSKKKTILKGEEVRKIIEEMATKIAQSHESSEDLVIVGIQKGGVELAHRILNILKEAASFEPQMGTLDINLYRDDWTRIGTKPVVRTTNLPFSIDDKNIILVDDVLFTGRTVRAALDALTDFGRPKRIELAVLVDRGHRELPICAQYVGLSINTKLDEHVDVYWKNDVGEDRIEVKLNDNEDK
ncbi:MAG TPA: bifunctional pyr operon transcriptional regulator/uracil phosphoribosyltransferase PyrR [Deltaproteobacteria bacterium]|nr:MAG: bifunctional pyr operon transcriptional regulator/uracil phosphoribosyltransferase PyrR [Deltaproteobacteria bacterium]HEC31515.1 bifunctional pyr operon transcriptional regulator/uracil phosphoribosyltransferase PyrR [Deltaproteobacteria bacterium]